MHSHKLDLALKNIFDEYLLSAKKSSISELDLIRKLQQAPFLLFPDFSFTDSFSLFQVHFALYNALYRLQSELLTQQTYIIEIELSRINIQPYTSINSLQIAQLQPLREYYLDWRNFSQTKANDVDDMLNDFWRKMSAYGTEGDDISRAHNILGTHNALSKQEIKKAYKVLSVNAHPDKGGSVKQFQQILWAWQLLNSTFI